MRSWSPYTFIRIAAFALPPFGQFRQRVPGKPVNSPVLHRFRSQRKVEVNAGLVPIQAPPFQETAAPLNRYLRQFPEKCLAIAATAIFRPHIQILQVNPGAAEEGGKVVEEQRIPNRLNAKHY